LQSGQKAFPFCLQKKARLYIIKKSGRAGKNERREKEAQRKDECQ
jgi:hypothetical protein